jgi:serine/threonine-protein kinase
MATVVGQVLNDRYEILEKIGEGGMAVAYRGRDRVLGRVVAIKLMRPELASDAAFVARFRREARAAAGITHEHIAGVYDTGSDGPHHYIVMEHVEGESMRDRLRREGPLPLREALRIAAETAEALEAAHQSGVVHRDIKPHNILLGQDGSVKVTDFGIARAASAPSQTDTSSVLGTVNYVSPEQARGEAVGPQGDIYSLGATLFEALTGKPPFNGGDQLAILHKHVYDRPPRPSEFRPGLPPEVDSLVGHCLEKELAKRFASARELLSYLSACPRVEETTAVRAARSRIRRAMSGPFVAAFAWMHNRGLWLLLALLVSLGAVAGIVRYTSLDARAEMSRVPDVLGMGSKTTRETLEGLGLAYRQWGTRPSDDVVKGAVLLQDPAPGLLVRQGTVVKVVLSEGPSHVLVPNVTEMTIPSAQDNLEAAGLTTGTVDQSYSDTVPAGYVASTYPAAGARVVPGTAVAIVLSLGPERPGPTGPPLPPPPTGGATREETLEYVVPADVSDGGEVVVTIEVADENGTRRIYQGRHRPGDRIPPQKITVTAPTTARILVDGELRGTREYLP